MLHPVLLEKLNAALAPLSFPPLTRRDARLPAVPGKVHAVVGMRRAGKTTFLRQLQTARRESLPPERAVRALAQAARIHPRATRRLLVLVRDPANPTEVSGVILQPAYEWLLAEPEESSR